MAREKVSVQFLKAWRSYNTGEVAGFDKETASFLKEKEIARPTSNIKNTIMNTGSKTGPGMVKKGPGRPRKRLSSQS